MIIHSKDHVTNIQEVSVQPNAVDLHVATLETLLPSRITISENHKKEWGLREPTLLIDNEFWELKPFHAYQFETDHTVNVPEGMAGWLIIRSTLARNGMLIGNGLYDAGYNGMIGGVLHNGPRHVRLYPGTRIAQFIMAKAETSHAYAGYYNTNGGVSK